MTGLREGGDGIMFGYDKLKIDRVLEEEQKEQKENQMKWYNYLISVLIVLVGAVFAAYTGITIPFVCRFVAFVFIAAGIVSILSYCIRDVASGYYRLELVYGIMAVFIALVIYTKQDAVEVYFPVIVGIVLFANGVVKLQHSIDMKRIDRKMKKVTEMWLVVMIFALMCIAAGSIAIYLTPADNRTLFLFVGISLIAAGASDVFVHIVFNQKVKMFKRGDYLTEEDKKEEKPAIQEAKEVSLEAPEEIREEIPADTTADITEEVAKEFHEDTPDETGDQQSDAVTENNNDADQQA